MGFIEFRITGARIHGMDGGTSAMLESDDSLRREGAVVETPCLDENARPWWILIVVAIGVLIIWHTHSNSSSDRSSTAIPFSASNQTKTTPTRTAIPLRPQTVETTTDSEYVAGLPEEQVFGSSDSSNDPNDESLLVPTAADLRCSGVGCSVAPSWGCEYDQIVITETGYFYPPSAVARPQAAYCADNSWEIPAWADNGLDPLNRCSRVPGACVAADGGQCSGFDTDTCIPYDSALSWYRCDGHDCAYDPLELDGIDTGDPLDPDRSSNLFHKDDPNFPTPVPWDAESPAWLKPTPDDDFAPYGDDDGAFDDDFLIEDEFGSDDNFLVDDPGDQLSPGGGSDCFSDPFHSDC